MHTLNLQQIVGCAMKNMEIDLVLEWKNTYLNGNAMLKFYIWADAVAYYRIH